MLRPALFLLSAVALLACSHAPPPAPTPPPTCPPATPAPAARVAGEERVSLEGFSLVKNEADFADPETTAEERKTIREWGDGSWAAIVAFFGKPAAKRPTLISCLTDACALRFSGPTRRSRAFIESNRIVVNGLGRLTRGTILHEMVHVEIAARMGQGWRRLPTWFDEGVASYVGDNAPCPEGNMRAVDDLRWLATPHAWNGVTNMPGKITASYCQVRLEIAGWVEKRGKKAVVEVIDAVAAGKPFDDLYGPLVTALPPDRFSRRLDAHFALDENTGVDVANAGTGSHIASLMAGAVWTTGRRGAAVKVHDGAHVRADGFTSFGVPDSPFTIAMWVKPIANAKVLVHTAMNPGGGDGWCLPLLGFDKQGHLAAQISFAPDPKSFVTVVGPAPALGKWTHVATTWSAEDGARLYVDGAPSASTAPRAPEERHRDSTASPTYLFFGSDNGARCWSQVVEPGHFDGALDDIRVYDHALTAAQIADLKK